MGEPDVRADRAPTTPRACSATPRSAASAATAFIADPSQQLAFSEGELIRDLIDGAAYLFSNEYESHMIESKTGWSADEILDRVGTQVTTLGADGVRILRARRGADRACRPRRTSRAVEPTGVGDAFRAGFLAGPRVGPRPRARRPGRLRARGVRRRDGRHPGVRLHRRSSSSSGSRTSYGDEAAADVAPAPDLGRRQPSRRTT